MYQGNVFVQTRLKNCNCSSGPLLRHGCHLFQGLWTESQCNLIKWEALIIPTCPNTCPLQLRVISFSLRVEFFQPPVLINSECSSAAWASHGSARQHSQCFLDNTHHCSAAKQLRSKPSPSPAPQPRFQGSFHPPDPNKRFCPFTN